MSLHHSFTHLRRWRTVNDIDSSITTGKSEFLVARLLFNYYLHIGTIVKTNQVNGPSSAHLEYMLEVCYLLLQLLSLSLCRQAAYTAKPSFEAWYQHPARTRPMCYSDLRLLQMTGLFDMKPFRQGLQYAKRSFSGDQYVVHLFNRYVVHTFIGRRSSPRPQSIFNHRRAPGRSFFLIV